MKTIVLLAAGIVSCGVTAAQAADLATAPPEPVAPAAPASVYIGPTFAFTGYLWATSLTGKTSTLPPLPAANIDLKFGDILQNLDGGIMGAGELRIDRWGFVTDVMYSKVTAGGDLPGPFFSSVSVRMQSLMAQESVLYRVFSNESVDIDFGAGLRYWNLDTKLTIKPGLINRRIDYSESEDWFDPVVAARIITRLNDRWSLTFAGDIGGFDIGSKLTYQLLGTVNYKWNDNLTLRAGYRLMSVDYEKHNYEYDVRMYGPIVGLTYRF